MLAIVRSVLDMTGVSYFGRRAALGLVRTTMLRRRGN